VGFSNLTDFQFPEWPAQSLQVEMLVERGAEKVVSFDILPQPPTAWQAGIGMGSFRWMDTDGPCKNAGILFGRNNIFRKHSAQYHLSNCGYSKWKLTIWVRMLFELFAVLASLKRSHRDFTPENMMVASDETPRCRLRFKDGNLGIPGSQRLCKK